MGEHSKKRREMLVSFLRNKKVPIFMMIILMILYLMMIFIIPKVDLRIVFILVISCFVLSLACILLLDAATVLQNTELETIQKNPIHYILFSDRHFTNHLFMWAIAFPLYYTILNVARFIFYSHIDFFGVMSVNSMMNTDFTFLLALVLVFISHFAITPKINRYFEKMIQH